jgi:hypothetical protein
MVIVLMGLALLPALYGVMITGDLTQFVYKPSRRQVYFVLTNRLYLIGGSLGLWAAGLAWHFLVEPASLLVIVIGTVLLFLFITMGYLMPGYIMFINLRQPNWITAEEANKNLPSDEPIIGFEINEDARAIPVEPILRPHMIHDVVGGEDVTMSYCMLSNSSMVYKAEFGGEKMRLMTPLQWENNMMMYDPGSKHLIQQVTGRVVGGPDDGQALETFPTLMMSWGTWQQLHPDTKVLYHPPRKLFDKLIRTMMRTQFYEPNRRQEETLFPTIEQFDTRLPNKTEVLGICAGDVCRAYPFAYLEEHSVINEELDDEPLLVAYDPKRDVGDVFRRRQNGRPLTFRHEIEADGNCFLFDEETGSKWDMTGTAVAGPLEGSRLEPYAHFSRVFWFSWANFYPETELAS